MEVINMNWNCHQCWHTSCKESNEELHDHLCWKNKSKVSTENNQYSLKSYLIVKFQNRLIISSIWAVMSLFVMHGIWIANLLSFRCVWEYCGVRLWKKKQMKFHKVMAGSTHLYGSFWVVRKHDLIKIQASDMAFWRYVEGCNWEDHIMKTYGQN